MQTIYDSYKRIDDVLLQENTNSVFLICGNSMKKLSIAEYFEQLEQRVTIEQFHDYTSNPKIEAVEKAYRLWEERKSDLIIAVGGGSAIDVAKCLKQKINQNGQDRYRKLVAIPTTAGTGSEATQFAVIYVDGEKKSIDDPDILPEYVVLDSTLLKGLPDYQRKATLLDALCQAIESIWAKKATKGSQELAAEAIRLILAGLEGYLQDESEGNQLMLQGANLAGQAINQTRTTAAHAMSYKLTSLFGLAHGHAVAICLQVIWKKMLIEKTEISDSLKDAYHIIADSMGCADVTEAWQKFDQLVESMHFEKREMQEEEHLAELVKSVNIQRLGNHPVDFTEKDLEEMYEQIIKKNSI